jgi:hypothetical protein
VDRAGAHAGSGDAGWSSPGSLFGALCAGLGALGGALVFVAAHRALIDDAYITLDYARTLAQHGQWGLQPGHPANTATSPLNVVLLAGLIRLSGAPVLAVGILLIILLTATGYALCVICARLGRSPWLAAIAASLLAVNPLLISTIGLETYLAVALIAALGAAVVAQRPVIAGLLCGLLVLTRADLATFALAGLIALTASLPAGMRARGFGRVIGLVTVVALPWFAASWWWLGSAVPDTLLFKTSEVWPGTSFATGLLRYARGFPLAVGLSVLPAAAGVAFLAGWAAMGARRRSGPVRLLVVVWGLGVILHLLVYLLLGPPPYHWYYGPAIGALIMLAVLGVAGLSPPLRWAGLPVGVLVIAATGVFLVGRPWAVMPISSNWASAAEYAALAAKIPSGSAVETFGEVGTVAYFCDCTVVDRLSERAQVADVLRTKRAAAGPAMQTLLDWNYYRFRAPARIQPVYKLTFAEDPTGIHATSWLPYAGQMVIRPVNHYEKPQ